MESTKEEVTAYVDTDMPLPEEAFNAGLSLVDGVTSMKADSINSIL